MPIDKSFTLEIEYRHWLKKSFLTIEDVLINFLSAR